MAKECAYCGLPGRMTREHIWPAGFIRRGEFGIKYSAKARRTFKSDLVVRDVCEDCNNGPLSVLDGYACKLYDRNFGQFPEHLTPVGFAYEYGLLTRWLIKIAFNSARMQGHDDTALLARYREAILASGDNCPLHVDVFLALVGPGSLRSSEGPPHKTIYPHAARSGPIIVPGVDGYQHVATRVVMINGYFFTLVLTRGPSVPANEVADLRRRIPGEPLALDGHMELYTTMNANQAIAGIEGWPRGSKAMR